MKTLKLSILLFATSMATSLAIAQPVSGMGQGMGGPKYGFNSGNAYGWQMMSQDERAAHRQKMHSLKTYEECKAYQEEHHAQMEARAKEKGKTLPAPHNNACDQMKARGFIK